MKLLRWAVLVLGLAIPHTATAQSVIEVQFANFDPAATQKKLVDRLTPILDLTGAIKAAMSVNENVLGGLDGVLAARSASLEAVVGIQETLVHKDVMTTLGWYVEALVNAKVPERAAILKGRYLAVEQATSLLSASLQALEVPTSLEAFGIELQATYRAQVVAADNIERNIRAFLAELADAKDITLSAKRLSEAPI